MKVDESSIDVRHYDNFKQHLITSCIHLLHLMNFDELALNFANALLKSLKIARPWHAAAGSASGAPVAAQYAAPVGLGKKEAQISARDPQRSSARIGKAQYIHLFYETSATH